MVTNVIYLVMDICVKVMKLEVKFGQGSVDYHVFEYFYFTKYTHTKSRKLLGKVHIFLDKWFAKSTRPE